MKRKKMIKLLMAYGIPRNKAVFYADLCGGKLSHLYGAAFALVRPDLVNPLWNCWVKKFRRRGYHPKLELVRGGGV